VLQTLKDEQEHAAFTRTHGACGIEFGELPVSGYFWRCVAPMENPIDYADGLCSPESRQTWILPATARGSSKVGDADTANFERKPR
jgi:hypothetical protein